MLTGSAQTSSMVVLNNRTLIEGEPRVGSLIKFYQSLVETKENTMGLKKALTGLTIVGTLATVGFIAGGFHSIDNGEYAVVKSFNGNTKIIDQPGWFVNYGTETFYPDYMTLDFGGDGQTASMNISPVPVKYAEGGMGTIKGNVQIQLPLDNANRMKLHEKFGSKHAFIGQLVQNATGEALTFTAGLMESQEAYMTHRAQFRTYAKDQLTKGLYRTQMEQMTRQDSKGEDVVTFKAVPLKKDGQYLRQDSSPLEDFGVVVTQFNIQDWDFEKATMNRIAEKRDAENKVITSRARTETAEQEKKEAEAIAEKNKAIKEGEAEASAAVQVVEANRDKELAIIAAQRKVEEAKELKNQREAELEAAELEAQAIEVMSIAEAEAADRKIKAGGQLSAEQQTRIAIATELGRSFAAAQRPNVVVGGEGTNGELTGTSLDSFLQSMTAATATNLSAKAIK